MSFAVCPGVAIYGVMDLKFHNVSLVWQYFHFCCVHTKSHKSNSNWLKYLNFLKSTSTKMAAIVLSSAIVGPIAIAFVICLIGFGCAGVTGGSSAAAIQSGIGNVAAGSCFACKFYENDYNFTSFFNK